MHYNIGFPSVYLFPYVKYYWYMEKCIQSKSYTHRIVPSGLFEIIFYLEDLPESTDGKKPISDNILVSGHQKGYYDLRIRGNLTIFAIYFYPHGLSMLLDMPLTELYDINVPLRDILTGKISELEDKIFEKNGFEKKIEIVNSFLENEIKESNKSFHYEKIREAIRLINKSCGNTDIDTLASSCCLSRKQFERVFSEIIGTSPKKFQKIVRFQNAIHQKSKNENISLTELSHSCGYFDQAHMINDFKTLSGLTPKKYFEYCEPFSDYFG